METLREYIDDYQEFYRLYYPKVLGYLHKRCSSEKTAEDLASICFIYSYEHWSDYDPSKASQASWIYMIARSRWANYCRDHRSFVDLDAISEFIPDQNDPMENAIRMESIRRELAKALNKMPEKQRQVVVLRYFGNLNDKEIAMRLNISPINVRVILSRSLKMMQKYVDPSFLDED